MTFKSNLCACAPAGAGVNDSKQSLIHTGSSETGNMNGKNGKYRIVAEALI